MQDGPTTIGWPTKPADSGVRQGVRARASEWMSGKQPRGSGWKRRLEILAAAERLLQASGPDAVTIRRIAADVGVAGALLYDHFPNRAALLEALCRSHLEALLQQMANAEGMAPEAARRLRLAAYFEFAFANPEVYRIAFAPLATASAQDGLAAGANAEARAVWALLSADPAQASASAEVRPIPEGTAWLAGAAHGIALVLTGAVGVGTGAAKSPQELAERLAWMVEASGKQVRPAAPALLR